jgi:hypothetical protein
VDRRDHDIKLVLEQRCGGDVRPGTITVPAIVGATRSQGSASKAAADSRGGGRGPEVADRKKGHAPVNSSR